MSGLVDLEGRPLHHQKQIKRREMKAAQIKKTPQGDVYFKLVVDIPEGLGEDGFNKVMYEYGNIISEAYRKRLG